MSLFGWFGSKNPSETNNNESIPWKPLTTVEQLEDIEAESRTTPVAIFKHSTRCGISRMVLRNFERAYDLEANQIKPYYLDLLAFREVSDEVGYKFQVVHQSPQLIVVKNGATVAHASHHGIQAASLQQYV
ncbi:MAG: bacillithiol system redox-active protein YtxJ [Bacteroidia bacterium]|nr:bacillithiol system redox-active protein YtxJ [Bacteroidia bacterium]